MEKISKTHKLDKSSKNHKVLKDRKKMEGSLTRNALLKQGKDHRTDITELTNTGPRRRSLPFKLLPAERIAADPNFTSLAAAKVIESTKLFSIGTLQQYTNSFSQENLIGNGTLGAVYRAKLPNGKVLAVKKVDKSASVHLSDVELLELVSSVSKLRLGNIVELVGYCLEHGERLLIYNICGNRTLDESLYSDDKIEKKLTWNNRMALALQAAKVLEYLHETCQPPIMHHNFKSCNLLLNDDLSLQVSDCGLASLMPSNAIQLHCHGLRT